MAQLLNHYFRDNDSFAFEAMRAAGYANAGAADVAEVAAICSRITSGNEFQWLEEWKNAADRAVRHAESSLSRGNKPGAKEGFLRASNYYRTAEFYRREDPRNDVISMDLAELSCNTFLRAADLMPYVTEAVRIPYEGTSLPGILMKPDAGHDPKPLLIANGGFDSTKEEVFYSLAPIALELGMNVLAFEGPGQGDAVRKQKLTFRHDWENVVTPVVDYAINQRGVDSSKIVLVGISMGGYLAARASAFEHRLAAVVLNDGVFDFGACFRKGESKDSPDMRPVFETKQWDHLINTKVCQNAARDTGLKWAMSNAKYTFGTDSAAEIIRETAKYTLEDVVHLIKTPTLVLDAPDDHFMMDQPTELFNMLSCEKDLIALTQKEGGSLHCHVGAPSRLSQVIFDWLLGKLVKTTV